MHRATFVAAPGRLDTVVAEQLRIARAEAQRAIAEGRVLVDGHIREKSFRLAGGEAIVTAVRELGDIEPDPEPLPLVYEDRYLMVVSKPAGLPSHPTRTRRTGTLVNRLLALGVPLSRAAGEDRPGIVHRLDAGTSGLMVVAKDDSTHSALSAMFRRHAVDRRYLALVRGAVRQDAFLIEAPLERRKARIRIGVTGKRAATQIQVRERLGRATLVEARPRTGRTHQIRVHLASTGHPILGDRAYGGSGDDAARFGLTRPFLHSWRIAFDHPVTGERVQLEDPLPPDLVDALSRARTAARLRG